MNYHGGGAGGSGDIRFSEPARYFAFGFRDAGSVTELSMTCDGNEMSACYGTLTLTDRPADRPTAYSLTHSLTRSLNKAYSQPLVRVRVMCRVMC